MTSAIINKLNGILPPHIMEIINSKYIQIDTILKPYNLPIQTDLILLILISIIFIFIISKLFGGNNNKSRVRNSGNSHISGSGSNKKGNNIVLVGLSNSGKTALFLNLTMEKKIPTHTSITSNNGVYIVPSNKKKLPIIDVPGNGKIKSQLPQILSKAGCIIYTIDSTTFIDNSTQEAQYLYDILTNESVYQKRIPVLIFNNKSDLEESIDIEQVTIILERELDDLRRTRGATPIILGQEEDNKEIYLGIEGTPFQFDHLQNDVQFSKGSAAPVNNDNNDESSTGIDDIKNFIQTTIN